MAKNDFSQEVRDEYKQNVREIKVKGNIYLENEGESESSNLLSLDAFNGYTSDDLSFTTSSNRVRITGNTPTSGSSQYYYIVQITEENFDTFNVKRETQLYKFNMKVLNNEYNTRVKVSLLFKRSDNYESVYELSTNWEIYELLTNRNNMSYYIPGYPEYIEIKGIQFYFMTPSGATHDVDLELELSFQEEDPTKVTGPTLMPNYVGSKDLGNGVTVSINKNIFTFSGTANASGEVSLLPDDYPLSSFILPAGNYVFRSGDNVIPPTIVYRKEGGGTGNKQLQCTWMPTYTFDTSIQITDLHFWFNSGSTYNHTSDFTVFEDREGAGDVFTIGEGTRPSNNLSPNLNGIFYEEITQEPVLFVNSTSYKMKSIWDGGFSQSYEFDNVNLSLPAGTYTFSLIEESRNSEVNHDLSMTFDLGGTSFWISSGIGSPFPTRTVIVNDVTINRITGWATAYGKIEASFKLMINKGSSALPYEDIGEVPNPQILDFKVDEKTDLYYETMPFSELSIDVDNTDGFFSDFSENSITDRLNKNCFIDFYLDVNNTGWVRAWRMQFDDLKISTDKATLSFKPYCLTHRDVNMLYDKNSQLVSGNNLDFPEFNDYFEDNYGFSVLTDRTEEGGAFIPDLGELLHVRRKTFDLTRMMMEMGTVLDVIQWGQILTISDNKAYKYRVWLGDVVDNIDNNILVEKPIIVKEIITGVRHVFDYYRGWLSGQHDYKKTIKGTLQSSHDNIILYDDDYMIDELATNYQSKMTATGCTIVSCEATRNIANIGIEGTKGNSYTIEINTQLQYKVHEEDKGEKTEDKENENYGFIIFTGSIRLGSYFEYLKRILRKKINMNIKALPYLQVGDVIGLEGEPNGTKIIITSIRTTWSSGFKMEIEGYEVEVPYY